MGGNGWKIARHISRYHPSEIWKQWKVFERCSLSSFGETCLVYWGFGSGVDEGIANSQRNSAIFNPWYPICSGCLTSAIAVVPRLNVFSVCMCVCSLTLRDI